MKQDTLINVYIIENHVLFGQLLHEFVDYLSGVTVCGTSRYGKEALAQVAKVHPDLVIVDLSLPDMNGLEVVRQLHLAWPALPTLILTSYTAPLYVERGIAAGARGYVVKGAPQEIELAIRYVMAGEIYLSPQLRERTN